MKKKVSTKGMKSLETILSDQTHLISLKNHQIWWPGTCYLTLIEHYKIENVVMERLVKATIICNKLKETKMKSHCLVPVK